MLRHSSVTFTLLSVLVINSCTNVGVRSNSLIMIDFLSNKDNLLQINLSQLSDDIEYIPLQKKGDLTLSGIEQCDFSDSLLLVSDFNVCFLYYRNGNLISRIGTMGRGPGEYQTITSLGLWRNRKIYLQSSFDLLEYNIDGSFIKKYVNIQRINTERISSWLPIDDSLFFGFVSNSTGHEENKAVIYNINGHLKCKFKNYGIVNRKNVVVSYLETFANLYRFKKMVFFKQIYNDTLFYLNSRNKLIPVYHFNFGKYSLPILEGEQTPLDYFSKLDNYIWLDNVFQTSGFLFLDCNFNNYFPAKRLTPKTLMTGVTTDYNTTNVLGLFNKQTNNLSFCKPTSTDNPLFTSGLYNDIDAGPRFFPKKMVNDSTMVMWIQAKQLKDHVASGDFKNSVPKYPEKKKKLEKFANNLNELDNPVLMSVTFKK